MSARASAIALVAALAACSVRKTQDAATGGLAAEGSETLLLQSNQEGTVFFVDGHKVGVGKRIVARVGDAAHAVRAQPPGYVSKELQLQPPYDPSYPHQFVFLIEDQLDEQRPSRPAPRPPAGPNPPAAGTVPFDVGRSAAPQPASYAIVVGIERYQEALPPPTGARRDAQNVAAYLQQALGVPQDHVRLEVDERATKGALERDLAWAKGNVPRGGRVYFYFSGHGSPAPDGSAYLVPYDGDPKYLEQTAVPIAKVSADLAATPAKEAVVLLDACFSGAGGRSVLPPGARPMVRVKEAAPATNVVTFAASAATEISGPTADGSGGLFTRTVLDGLRDGRADQDGDGAVSLDELAQWVTPRVAREAQTANRAQTPSLAAGAGLHPKDVLVSWGLARR